MAVHEAGKNGRKIVRHFYPASAAEPPMPDCDQGVAAPFDNSSGWAVLSLIQPSAAGTKFAVTGPIIAVSGDASVKAG